MCSSLQWAFHSMTIANSILVVFFDPNRHQLVQRLCCLEHAFQVFQIREDRDKVAYLLHFVGVEAFGNLYDQLTPTDPYMQSYDALVEKLKEFYASESLEIAEVYIFRK